MSGRSLSVRSGLTNLSPKKSLEVIVDIKGVQPEDEFAVSKLPTNGCDESHSLRMGQQGLLVSFADLSYTVGVKRRQQLRLLSNVKGFFKPGAMTALMGASGSGKTTLLDVLSGRKTTGKIEGKIWYGLEPPTHTFLRRHTGYVEQFDTLLETLTVYEMLLYTAELKLQVTVPFEEKQQAVEGLIEFLDLSSCRDTRIGGAGKRGVSGGQAKRCNIGVSLVTNPYVLYLDEPTSGLDSFTAEEVMSYVQNFCNHRRLTVCATIHSPTAKVFSMFDQLMLLIGGYVVYFGPCGQPAVDYFTGRQLAQVPYNEKHDGMSEWIVRLVTTAGKEPGKAQSLAEAYEASEVRAQMDQQAQRELYALRSASKLGHFSDPVAADDPRAGRGTAVNTRRALAVYFRYRSLRNYRSPIFLSARIVDKLIILSIMASLYWNSGRDETFRKANMTASMLFMWAATPGFGAAAYLPTIMLERHLFYRELSDGLYSKLTYYIAKWLEEILIVIPISLVACTILWFAVGLQGDFMVFWFVWFLTQLTAIGLAFTFASVSPTLDFANGAVPSYGATLLFFAGFLVLLSDVPGWWYWYTFVTYLRYPYTALMINNFRGSLSSNISVCSTSGSETVLQYYGMDNFNLGNNIGGTIGWMLGFMVAAFVAMRYINYNIR